MKIAVIKTGGKQYVVKEKDQVKVEKLKAETGNKVEFDALLIADGDKIDLGSPVLTTKVEGKVLGLGRAKKVVGVKYKPKTRESKKFGHRQEFTLVEISKI
ncbi:MAG: 50S ribosomal protein L21 [Candidatus Buchananbacteria bacterium]|nr:50S ribosomal protein L21 [Candidatus Buchananbacteria bacterium]